MEKTTIEKLKQGDYFTINPIDEPKASQVYVRCDYDRSYKRYIGSKWSDISAWRGFKKGTIVYVGFTF